MIDIGINLETAAAGGLMAVVAYVSVEIFKLCVKMTKKWLKSHQNAHVRKHIPE